MVCVGAVRIVSHRGSDKVIKEYAEKIKYWIDIVTIKDVLQKVGILDHFFGYKSDRSPFRCAWNVNMTLFDGTQTKHWLKPLH